MTDFGLVMEASPGYTAKLAAEIEAMGFDLLLCPDTQNLSPDPIGQLSLAAKSTTRLRLGTGVTNPLTRDVAVTATSFLTLQAESAGRAHCGIGRGDSSAAHIGRSNGTTAELREFVTRMQAYMRGESVDRNGKASALRWLDSVSVAPVPMDIACSGPKTIAMAVEVADCVSFAVGSAPERLRWALDIARQQLLRSGRARDSIRLGAYINLVCDPDKQRALQLGRMIAGMVAHFAGLKGVSLEHLPAPLKPIAAALQAGYDMARHSKDAGSHLAIIDDNFVDWFSICGPPAYCRDRLQELLSLGLDHVYILGGSPVAHPHAARQVAMVEQTRLFADKVLTFFR